MSLDAVFDFDGWYPFIDEDISYSNILVSKKLTYLYERNIQKKMNLLLLFTSD